MSMYLCNWRLSGLVLLTLLACGASVRASPPTSQPTPVFELALRDFEDPILVPVIWLGMEKHFILDTGAAYTVLDETAFGKLPLTGKTMTLETSSGRAVAHVVDSPDLQVGPFQLKDHQPILLANLAAMRMSTGFPVIGILGMDAMRGSVLQIDFDHHAVRFFQADRAPRPAGESAVPIEYVGGIPTISARVADEKIPFIVDSGWLGDGCLPKDAFDRISALTKSKAPAVMRVTGAGIDRVRVLKAPSLNVGGRDYRDLVFGQTNGSCGLLGAPFLFRHNVVLDFPNSKLYLQPSGEIDRRQYNLSGMSLLKVADQVRATGVLQDGPAFNSGLRDQDVILSVDEHPVHDLTLSQVYQLLRVGEGRIVTVEYRRADSTLVAKIKLRTIF